MEYFTLIFYLRFHAFLIKSFFIIYFYIIISMRAQQNTSKKQDLLETSLFPTLPNSKFCTSQIKQSENKEQRDFHKQSQQAGKIKKNIKFSNIYKTTIFLSSQIDQTFLKKTVKKVQNIEKSKQFKKQASIKRSNNFKSQKQIGFKAKMRSFRIQNLVQHFISKLKRTSIYRNPIQYQPFHSQEYQMHNFEGLQLHKTLTYIFFAISAIVTVGICLISTFLLVFHEQIRSTESIRHFFIFSIFWILLQICLGFTRIRQKGSKKMKKLKQIAKTYFKYQFFIDIMFLFSIVSQFNKFFHEYPTAVLMLVFFKLPDALKKLKKFENKLLEYVYYQHYWGLTKMFLLNFFFAHIIAIALLCMVEFDRTQNWLVEKGLMGSCWFEKYYWAYYWATTTMLSVGYGDIVATNYRQAIVVSMVESISCMALGYNINCIGNLLVQLRLKQIEKQKHLKVLKQVYDRQQIEQELQFKIQNHIKQAYKMQKKLNFDRYLEFVQKLPNNLKKEFLRQSNKNFIKKVQFLKNFTNKTILRLAQKLQARMILPWQPALRHQSKQIAILKQGQVGLCPNFGNYKYNQIIIDRFVSQDQDQPHLISLQFVRSNLLIKNYQLKSIGYSVTSSISFKDFLQILKRSNVDFQHFFSFKDKQHKNQEFQLIRCEQCSANHSKFTCPKLHYTPIFQKVIFKYLKTVKQSKTKRKAFDRIKPQSQALKVFKIYNEIIQFGEQSAQFIDSKDSAIVIDIKSLKPKDSSFVESKNQKFNYLRPQSIPFIFHRQPRTKIYSKQIAQNVKTQLIQFLKKQNNTDFWPVQVDKAKDYHFYLIEYNPKLFQQTELKKCYANKLCNKKMI